MTRRPHRVLAALSALWFAMLMVAGPMLHQCAMHDGVVAGATSAGPEHGHGGAHGPAPADDECEHCTCLGDCASAAMAPAIAGSDRGSVRVIDRALDRPAGALAPSIGSPHVRLPFSVGLPLLA